MSLKIKDKRTRTIVFQSANVGAADTIKERLAVYNAETGAFFSVDKVIPTSSATNSQCVLQVPIHTKLQIGIKEDFENTYLEIFINGARSANIKTANRNKALLPIINATDIANPINFVMS